MYFGTPATVVLETLAAAFPGAIDGLTAIIGVNPSAPAGPVAPVCPVGPVGPCEPVAPDGITSESFFNVDDQETEGEAVGFAAVTATVVIGELSTALHTTWKTPATLKVKPETLSVPEHESLF